MRNFFQATENIGTSGQPTRDEFSDIARQGYRTVINLAMHNSDDAMADEGNLVTSLGMSYIHLPIPFDAPTSEQGAKFIRLLRALEGEKVWVHCVVNARVSAFVYLYLVQEKGIAPERATSPVLQGWEPKMTPAWQQFLTLTRTDLGLS